MFIKQISFTEIVFVNVGLAKTECIQSKMAGMI